MPTHYPEDGADAARALLDSVHDASALFFVRLSGLAPTSPSPIDVVRDALQRVLLEPCRLELFLFADAVTAVVTPTNDRAFDPLSIRSIQEMLRRDLDAICVPGEDGHGGSTILALAGVTATEDVQENLQALNELLETIVNHRLSAQFQPIVHLGGGRVLGYEALIRAPQMGNLKRMGHLFQAADRARIVSWLDIACVEQCLEMAAAAGVRDYLFINMDAEGLSHLHFAGQSLADRAQQLGVSPTRIVLEVTERQWVEDFPRLVQYIDALRGEGIRIAIDDAGAGYSSLHTIAELRPDFVKIDRSLVRGIESNGTRRALLSTLASYAMQIGTAVIAEGIETQDELGTIVELGVSCGQGYLLAKPANGFQGVRRTIREMLEVHRARRRRRLTGLTYPIRDMAHHGVTLPSAAREDQIQTVFKRNPDLESVVLVDEQRIMGLLRRETFERAGPDERAQQSAFAWREANPLIVEADTAIEEVAARVSFRPSFQYHHDILVEEEGLYAGVVPVRALLKSLTGLSLQRARYTDPLTNLPGMMRAEQAGNDRLRAGLPTTILRADIRHFKEFNRTFDVARGDEVILAAGRALAGALDAVVGDHRALFHIGGDDFVALCAPEHAADVCELAISAFDEMAERFYPQDAVPGVYLESVDSNGEPHRTPIVRLHIVGVSNANRPLDDFSKVADALKRAIREMPVENASRYRLLAPPAAPARQAA